MPSIKELIDEATLSIGSVAQSPRKEAYLLLSYLLQKDKTYLFLHEDDEVKKAKEFKMLCQRRAEGEPIEYITNRVSFYSEEFFIDKGALIPRPETELLIDEVLKVAKDIEKKPVCIAEIGVGSGIISIMLSKLIKDVKIIATDISKDALRIAKTNIKRFVVEDKIKLLHGAYLENIDEKIDIVVSNPPYVADDFFVEKPLKYEPKEAIFGGKRGDEILENIIKLVKNKEISYLVCEMGYDQKENITKILKDSGFQEFSFYKDLAGLDRGFVAKKEKNV